MQYRADIDGLRAVAVAGVVLSHAGLPGLGGGFAGVDVFFVISGYLIASLFLEEQARTGRVDLPAFAARRLRRLLPALLALLVVCVPVAYLVLLPQQLKDFGQGVAAAPFFLANLLYWQEAGYFAAVSAEKPLLHLWSLGVEGQFYLLAPLVLLRGRGLVAGLAVLGFVAASWAAREVPEAAFYLAPFRLWEFLAGALLAFWPVQLPRIAGFLGLGLIGIAFWTLDGATAWPGAAALLPVVGAMLVIAGGSDVLARRGPVFLGRISYGVYLWHYPVLTFFALAHPKVSMAVAGPWLVLGSVLLGWASWRWIERPFRGEGSCGWAPGVALALVVTGTGYHLLNGLPGRLPGETREILALTQTATTRCHDSLDASAIERGERCLIGALGVAPSLALIGDSHADHLGPALSRALAARGQAAVVYTGSWCVPVPGFGARAPGRGRDCAGKMSAAWQEVLDDPALTTVIAAAQWGNVVEGGRGMLPSVRYGSAALAARAPEDNVTAMEVAFAPLAEQLRLSGKLVLMPEPVPEFDGSVPDRLARLAWAGDATGTLVPLGGERVQATQTALAKLALRSGAQLVPLRDLFCAPGADACRVLDRRGTPLWRDASHLSPAGATPVVARLMDIVDADLRQNGGRHDHLSLRQPADTERAREHVYR
ncbi:acyltransferase family protein [Halovulum sp. GXIMD14794]